MPHTIPALANAMSRRRFLQCAALAPAIVAAACSDTPGPYQFDPADATLLARPGTPSRSAAPGLRRLGLTTSGPDGFLYVPSGYDPAVAAPLLVLMHGAGQSSAMWTGVDLADLLDDAGIIALMPDSRSVTWDVQLSGTFGPDVDFIDDALALAFDLCRVDPARVGFGGFSDGGTYALSLGLANGDLFSHLLAFSPGNNLAPLYRGMPRVFVSHGTLDAVIPIDSASRLIVPALRGSGYDVTYREFAGGHTLPISVAAEATTWFTAAPAATR